MLDPVQFREQVIDPTLQHLEMHSLAASSLLLGTVIVESGLTWLIQHGPGPALGLYQIEPTTEEDIWENYLRYRPEIAKRVGLLLVLTQPRTEQLVWNLRYATAIARLVYWRRPEALPGLAEDVNGLGEYWKRYYNTAAGRGRAQDFVEKTRRWLT